MNRYCALALSTLCVVSVQSFSLPGSRVNQNAGQRHNNIIRRSGVQQEVPRSQNTALFAKITEAELKEELVQYLKKREELKADELAKA